MMKHLTLKRGTALFLSVIFVFTMAIVQSAIPVTAATLDFSASNWDLVQGFSDATYADGAVEFTGTTAYGNGIVYKNDIDISNEVSFDLQFTQQTFVGGSAWFAITLGQDNDSFNNPAKGVTFILYYKTDAAIECAQNSGFWFDFPFSQINTIKIKKGDTGWDLYFKNSVFTSDQLVASVPFGTVPYDTFSNGKAKLGIYVCDAASNPIKFKVSSLNDSSPGLPVEITGFDANTDIDAGMAGSAKYADTATVLAALPTTVTANSGTVTVPVTSWADVDTYNPLVPGSYTFTATLGTIPEGYLNTGNYTSSIEVVVAVPADIEITGFDKIANLNAGTLGSVTYANAAAVRAALPTTVKANSGTVTIPVASWADVDTYDPSKPGSYTFTAILGAIPDGFANTGAFTATIEVVVAKPVMDIQASNWDLLQGFTDVQYSNGVAQFTGATAYGNGVVYRGDLDVSEEVSFDLQFVEQHFVGGKGWFAITLGQDNNSFSPDNNNGKGVTFLLYYKTDVAIECAQNSGPWLDFPFSEYNTFKVRKGTAGWELYLQNSIFVEEKLVATVPFSKVSSSVLNGKAKLGIYVSDEESSPIKFNISKLTNIVNQVPPVIVISPVVTSTPVLYQLSIGIDGNGSGTVSPGIGIYDRTSGSIQIIQVIPAADSVFDGWYGENGKEVSSVGGDSYSIQMNQNKSIIARFRLSKETPNPSTETSTGEPETTTIPQPAESQENVEASEITDQTQVAMNNEIPGDSPELPKTGGIPIIALILTGILLIGAGLYKRIY